MKEKAGLSIKLRGVIPEDDSLSIAIGVFKELSAIASDRIVLARYETIQDAQFFIELTLWYPFGSPVPMRVWETIDILLTHKNIEIKVDTTQGFISPIKEVK